MAVCRGARVAGAKADSRVPRAAADGAGARAFGWDHHSRGSCSPRWGLPHRTLKIAAAVILFAFGLYRLLRSRHPNWVGMRVGFGSVPRRFGRSSWHQRTVRD